MLSQQLFLILLLLLPLHRLPAATPQPCFSDEDCCRFQAIGLICGPSGVCINQPRFLGHPCSRSLHCQLFVDVNADCVASVCRCRAGFFDQVGPFGMRGSCVGDPGHLDSWREAGSGAVIGVSFLRLLSTVINAFRFLF